MTGNRYNQVLNQHVMARFMVTEMSQATFQQDRAAPPVANPVKQLINSYLQGLDWPW